MRWTRSHTKGVDALRAQWSPRCCKICLKHFRFTWNKNYTGELENAQTYHLLKPSKQLHCTKKRELQTTRETQPKDYASRKFPDVAAFQAKIGFGSPRDKVWALYPGSEFWLSSLGPMTKIWICTCVGITANAFRWKWLTFFAHSQGNVFQCSKGVCVQRLQVDCTCSEDLELSRIVS